MPRRYKSRSRRRNTRARRRPRRGNRRIRRGRRRTKTLITTNSKNVRMRYIETLTLNIPLAAGSFNTAVWNLNGMYDPNTAIGGAAIPGFAGWSTFYYKYRVNMAVMRCTFTNTNGFPIYVGLAAQPTYTSLANWSACRGLVGNPWARVRLLGPSGASTMMTTLTLVVPMARIAGNKFVFKGEQDYTGTSGSNPTNIIPGIALVFSWDGLNTTASVPIDMRITYYSSFFDRNELVS